MALELPVIAFMNFQPFNLTSNVFHLIVFMISCKESPLKGIAVE